MLESNSVCRNCGREACGYKSLCCGAPVVTPREYAARYTPSDMILELIFALTKHIQELRKENKNLRLSLMYGHGNDVQQPCRVSDGITTALHDHPKLDL